MHGYEYKGEGHFWKTSSLEKWTIFFQLQRVLQLIFPIAAISLNWTKNRFKNGNIQYVYLGGGTEL